MMPDEGVVEVMMAAVVTDPVLLSFTKSLQCGTTTSRGNEGVDVL